MSNQGEALNTGRLPSPDNRGLEKEKPKDVKEEAAKVNRDVDALIEQVEETKNRKKAGK